MLTFFVKVRCYFHLVGVNNTTQSFMHDLVIWFWTPRGQRWAEIPGNFNRLTHQDDKPILRFLESIEGIRSQHRTGTAGLRVDFFWRNIFNFKSNHTVSPKTSTLFDLKSQSFKVIFNKQCKSLQTSTLRCVPSGPTRRKSPSPETQRKTHTHTRWTLSENSTTFGRRHRRRRRSKKVRVIE